MSANEELVLRGARAIYRSYVSFRTAFNAITRRAEERFERRDWHGAQSDHRTRLRLYTRIVEQTLTRIRGPLREQLDDRRFWGRMKQVYATLLPRGGNNELARTFFNSAARKVFRTVGVNPKIEHVTLEPAERDTTVDPQVYRRYFPQETTERLVQAILDDYRHKAAYHDSRADARLAARRIDDHLIALGIREPIEFVETLKPVFYRNKGAYIIGRLGSAGRLLPLVLPLAHTRQGVKLDAVLMDEDDVSVVFSFTRSYFHVDTEEPRAVIAFLESIMPLKPVAELYISLGFNKHGKTELYRNLMRHLRDSDDSFEIARGDVGMVMLVFTLPSLDIVFKIIRDRFARPKTVTHREVRDRYALVFELDRVGRLIDAQEFEHLKIGVERFAPPLLKELSEEAAQTVRIEADHVVIDHLYVERRITPLNLYIREADAAEARRALIDYGNAIKELAAADIFPGDFLLKNFGVTRHGRVVFYDYDELCPLSDCRFRRIPPAPTPEQEMDAEPWFGVREGDVFPEEFPRFLGLPPALREEFHDHHADLFTTELWRGLQARHAAGEILDVFPYPQNRRLNPGSPEA